MRRQNAWLRYERGVHKLDTMPRDRRIASARLALIRVRMRADGMEFNPFRGRVLPLAGLGVGADAGVDSAGYGTDRDTAGAAAVLVRARIRAARRVRRELPS